MGANPPKRDAWPQPQAWLHVWVRFNQGQQPPPMPGLVLEWRRQGTRWSAWVIWVDDSRLRRERKQDWIDAKYLRPARSDINIWNDGPWR
jgi:hypothetical protein